jgi:RNA polymerase sigma factor (sigma-70 family)
VKPSLEWTKLFRTEAPRLRRFLRRRFGARISPEDIAQESFARLCSVEEAVIVSPRAYLYRTARNLALNDLRHQRALSMINVPDPGEVDTGCAHGSNNGEELVRMRDMLDALPAHLRDVLIMHRLEGLNDRAIAKRMGVSRATAQRYLAQAVDQCHDALLNDRDSD